MNIRKIVIVIISILAFAVLLSSIDSGIQLSVFELIFLRYLEFLISTSLHPYVVFVIYIATFILIIYILYWLITKQRNPFHELSTRKKIELSLVVIVILAMTFFFYKHFTLPLVFDYPEPQTPFLSKVVQYLEDFLVSVGILK